MPFIQRDGRWDQGVDSEVQDEYGQAVARTSAKGGGSYGEEKVCLLVS
jgi:hypothetical protein